MPISFECIDTGNDDWTHYFIWSGRDRAYGSSAGIRRKSISFGIDAVPEKTSFKPLYILIAVLIVLTPIGLLATGTAWGEWGVDDMATLVSGGMQLGYTPAGMASGFELSTLFPDYSMAGMPEWTGYILSAVVGVALLVIFFKIVSSLMKDKVDFKKKAA